MRSQASVDCAAASSTRPRGFRHVDENGDAVDVGSDDVGHSVAVDIGDSHESAAATRYERGGGRKKKRIGSSKADKRQADQIARKINASLALGTFPSESAKPLPCATELRRWHAVYSATMKPSYVVLTRGLIENHLAPHFGERDLREVREADILEFIGVKRQAGLAPTTIRNSLSLLRRVCVLLGREGMLDRNPVSGVGELIRRVVRASDSEVKEVEHWSRGDIENLIGVAREHEPRFAPMLVLLFSSGIRRGEALGLQWADVDFDRSQIAIRRSITNAGVTTPKSGKARRLAMPSSLAAELFDVFAARRREALAYGWPEIPKWVFCSEVGTAPSPRNVERVWYRVRRRAQKVGVRPLKLHCTRHTWATMALASEKSVRWVADQLGHADPALTIRVYAHALQEEEADLSFAEFGSTKRPYTAPVDEDEIRDSDNCAETLARREGLEPPTLRFEA